MDSFDVKDVPAVLEFMFTGLLLLLPNVLINRPLVNGFMDEVEKRCVDQGLDVECLDVLRQALKDCVK